MFSSKQDELHDELNGNEIHRAENIITLQVAIHQAFDDLLLWFKPSHTKNNHLQNNKYSNQSHFAILSRIACALLRGGEFVWSIRTSSKGIKGDECASLEMTQLNTFLFTCPSALNKYIYNSKRQSFLEFWVK